MGVRYGGGQDAIRNVGYLFGWLADLFYALSSSVRDVPLLGKYLSGYFSWVGDFFIECENNCLAFAEYYGDVVKTAVAALPAASLGNAILTLFREWDEFRLNPKKWVWEKLKELFEKEKDFYKDFWDFLLKIVEKISKPLYKFLKEPKKQLLAWLSEINPDIKAFIENPTEKLRDWLKKISLDLYEIIDNPIGYFKKQVSKVFKLPDNFFDNPQENIIFYVLDGISLMGTEIRRKLLNLLENILYDLLER